MSDLREANFTAWHFLSPDRRLGNDDGRPIVAGETLFVEGQIELCRRGLHWSRKALDALDYAPGDHVSLIVPVGAILEGVDKGVSQGRRTLWMADATEVLREFSRWCALSVAHLWKMPPVVRQYLESGDESLREEARDEVMDAVMGAAEDSARHAATAARGAAEAPAWGAAAAARGAAEAEASARGAAEAEASARGAAWHAAAAAEDAARDAQNAELERRLMALAPPDGPQRRFL